MNFINEKYCETEGLELSEAKVRSKAQCWRDLKYRWGLYNGLNGKRPYCEGHEREDVVQVREKLLSDFTKYKAFYYTLKEGIWLNISKVSDVLVS